MFPESKVTEIYCMADEYGHGKQYFLLQFHKTVIRNLTRKKVFYGMVLRIQAASDNQ